MAYLVPTWLPHLVSLAAATLLVVGMKRSVPSSPDRSYAFRACPKRSR
jgi:hypothetical protein